jgi:hypothetical protein
LGAQDSSARPLTVQYWFAAPKPNISFWGMPRWFSPFQESFVLLASGDANGSTRARACQLHALSVPKRPPASTSPDHNMSRITMPITPKVGFVSLG